ncbi:hypothetical protein CsSME_00017817 [Camellia sinensis var. sinensis]
MVYLLGGHTVGVAHCSLFEDRLYNFQNSGKPDPIMNLVLLEILKSRCPQNATVDNTADLDENPVSAYAVDNSYYQQILLGKGILQIDQELALDPRTTDTVKYAAVVGYDFQIKFMLLLNGFDILYACSEWLLLSSWDFRSDKPARSHQHKLVLCSHIPHA